MKAVRERKNKQWPLPANAATTMHYHEDDEDEDDDYYRYYDYDDYCCEYNCKYY